MNMSLLAAIILISLILCAIAIPFFIRSFLWQSILKKIYKGQYDEAIQQMNAPLYTLLFTSLDIIERKGNEDEVAYDRMLYRILIEKKSEDISFVNELLSKNSDDQQQGILQYLLGLQYQYLSDVKQANYYFNKAKKNLKGTPYHKKVKESMV